MNIDNLDPSNNRIDKDNIAKFMSDFDHTYMDKTRPKGPDYLIIDNLAQFLKIENLDLLGASR